MTTRFEKDVVWFNRSLRSRSRRRVTVSLVSLAAILLLLSPVRSFSSGGDIAYNGSDDGRDVMLQAFHWESHQGGGGQSWYEIVKANAGEIGKYFTVAWMPPPAESVSAEGYLPRRWYKLDSQYGTSQQLIDAISALHGKNVKVLADVVINHRSADHKCNGQWAGFTDPTMTANVDFLVGQLPNDCGTGYPTATEGSWSQGGHTYNNDDFGGDGIADLNHWAGHMRNEVKAWLKWLKDASNAGFDGWRYDLIKGYDPAFLGEYNFESKPYLSVGESWDYDRQKLADVINRSGNQTMVFDFVLKNKMDDALQRRDHLYGGALGEPGENGSRGLIGWWSQAAVTLVDNHDTGFSRYLHPIPTPCDGDLISVKSAYALILTHPGIPSVYWYDWRDRDADLKFVIEELIRIRKDNNVKRWSRVWVDRAEDGLYAAYIGNEMEEQVAIKIGMQGWNNYESWQPAERLGLSHAFDRHDDGCHAFTVYYKNKSW